MPLVKGEARRLDVRDGRVKGEEADRASRTPKEREVLCLKAVLSLRREEERRRSTLTQGVLEKKVPPLRVRNHAVW